MRLPVHTQVVEPPVMHTDTRNVQQEQILTTLAVKRA